jgi:hypothetical protein
MVLGQDPLDSLKMSDAYKAAYEQGQAEADRELEDQVATIYTYGLPENPFNHLDRETGLPYSGFGCVVDDKILGRTEGHNDRIMESIKAHGLPKGSFKPWEKELFGLKDYVESRKKRDKPEIVTVNGPALKSPDGIYTIKPFVKEAKGIDGKVEKELAIEVSGDGRPPREVWLSSDVNGKVEWFWGPKGSGFVVAVIPATRADFLKAIDLRGARTLQSDVISQPEGSKGRPKD